MKRSGFTLIEIMVVISIIAVLSSVLFAATAQAKSTARDGARLLETEQINTAIQEYGLANGHAPDLQNVACLPTGSSSLNSSTVSGCTAMSDAATGTPQATGWTNLMTDLQPYLAGQKISDPCPSCTTNSGLPASYTYVAPAAVEYSCYYLGTCGQVGTDPINQYQFYAPLEGAAGYASYGQGYTGSVYSPTAIQPFVSMSKIWINVPTHPANWNVTANFGAGKNYQTCTISDSMGLTAGGTAYAPSVGFTVLIVPPSTGFTDTITATCTNYGVIGTASISVTG